MVSHFTKERLAEFQQIPKIKLDDEDDLNNGKIKTINNVKSVQVEQNKILEEEKQKKVETLTPERMAKEEIEQMTPIEETLGVVGNEGLSQKVVDLLKADYK